MSHGNITEFRGNNESDFDIACDDLNHTSSVIGKTVGFAFLFITSLMGNTMVAIVVYSGRRMKTTVNFMIVNMAVSDLLNTILVVPKSIMFIFTYPGAWFITGEIGDASCRIVHFLQDITVAVSLLSLLMIAIERFYAISCPVVANPIPDKKCVFMILSTWFVAFLMYITDLLSFRLAYVEEEGSICSHSWESLVADPGKATTIEFLLHTNLALIIPFIIVTALYSIILGKIRRISVPDEVSSVALNRRRKRNRNVLFILLAVVIAFGICWFPFIIYTYIVTFGYINKDQHSIPCGLEIYGEIALFMAYLQSSVNPTIYFTFSENYRQGLRRLIRHCLILSSNKSLSLNKNETQSMKRTKRRCWPGNGVVQCPNVELLNFDKL
ncbi:allatostatin-A receptor-like [Stylophora pistillata]|uniref:allatostatin-A receptor-like n=1 Tax=Stylophora pistillata TaxID=50429 RepID=UPI000C0427C7|nr:allatostatin-A receptor-like [Stylophora pistillata]